MIKDLRNGDIISFITTNHEVLGNPKSITVVAKCNYKTAVMLDPSLPNIVNRIIMDSGVPPYDPSSREYMVYEGTNGSRALDTSWIVENSIEYPTTTTVRITLHDVTLTEKDIGLEALNSLGFKYTVE